MKRIADLRVLTDDRGKLRSNSSEYDASLGSCLQEWLRTAEAEQCFRNFLENSTVGRWAPICEWLSNPDPAPGHEAYLVGHGEDVGTARLNARIFAYFGAAIAGEECLLKTVVGHVRRISQVRNRLRSPRWADKLKELDEVWASLGALSDAITKAPPAR